MMGGSTVAFGGACLRKSKITRQHQRQQGIVASSFTGDVSRGATTPWLENGPFRCKWFPRALSASSPGVSTHAIPYARAKRGDDRLSDFPRPPLTLTPRLRVGASNRRGIQRVVLHHIQNYDRLYFACHVATAFAVEFTTRQICGYFSIFLNNCALCNRRVFIVTER